MAHILPTGTILMITGNESSHGFKIGSFAIVANSESDLHKDRYVRAYSYSYNVGQYLTGKCYVIVDQISLPGSLADNSDEYVKYLNNWMIMQKKPDTLNAPIALLHAPARTQKARGLQALIGIGLLRQPVYMATKPVTNIPGAFPYMARPCPRVPRHGFVDSRIVKTLDELNQVIEETKAADPYGEVVIMPPIKSTYSAVVTDTAVTIGKGTDGATAGKSAITLQCNSNIRRVIQNHGKYIVRKSKSGKFVRANTLKYAGVQPTHGLFVETVGKELVQLRTGPAVDYAQTSYSTCEIVMPKEVFNPEGITNFLTYEQYLDKAVARFNDEEWYPHSMVIHLPHGSLASHYAVQAITRGFSVVTGVPEVPLGKFISFNAPAAKSALTPSASLRKSVTKAIAEGIEVSPTAESLEWAVSAIQGLGVGHKTEATVTMILAASVLLARTGVGLCYGEHRHFYHSGPGKRGYLPRGPIAPPFAVDDVYVKIRLDRNHVYKTAFTMAWDTIDIWYRSLAHMTAIEQDFRKGDWSGGFGGARWGECTQATTELLLALLPFVVWTKAVPMMASTAYTYDKEFLVVIAAANKLITLSHNSAKCLTKIIGGKTLQAITDGKAGLVLATYPLTWKLVK